MSFLTIAHRGASVDAPENTLESFRLAVSQGADMIETDLHCSRDGAIPLHHDLRLGGEPIGALSLAEIRRHVAEVPTLEEALDAVGEQIPFNLELKRPPQGEYAGLEQAALDEVRRRGWLARTLFSCFDEQVLLRVRELEPEARLGLLVTGDAEDGMEVRAARLGAESVHLPLSLARADSIEKLHAQGFRVHVFTVDDPEDQRRLLGWGVDGIFTNVPARLRGILG